MWYQGTGNGIHTSFMSVKSLVDFTDDDLRDAAVKFTAESKPGQWIVLSRKPKEGEKQFECAFMVFKVYC